MPKISVLTPVHASARPYLADTARSLLDQELPTGWEFEWIVQADGLDGNRLRPDFPDDPRIQFEADGAALGPAMTRNLGLARATGEFVQPLDADDLLLPGALATLAAAIDAHPQIHWAFGQAADLMPDGSRVTFDPWIPPAGLMPAGRLSSWVASHNGQSPIPCAGVAYRTTTLRAVGGWAALPVGEDVALLVTVSALTDGWQDSATTWLYRQHPDQISRHPAQPQWSAIAKQVALQRISALRLTDVRLTGTAAETEHLAPITESMKAPAILP
jgi:glycosyltransferase involved in cell wall biosynthesis